MKVAILADVESTAYHSLPKAVKGLEPGEVCVTVKAGRLGHVRIQVFTSTTLVIMYRNEDALKLMTELVADRVILGTDDGSFV